MVGSEVSIHSRGKFACGGSPSLLVDIYGVIRPEREVVHSSQSGTEVKNAPSFTPSARFSCCDAEV